MIKSSPITKKIDSQDLKAFEESFSSDDSFEELLVAKLDPPPNNKRNETFENDFNSDFSDEENKNSSQSLENVFIKKNSSLKISDLETSSPSFHRTETLYKNVSFKTPPVSTSTQIPKIYPDMNEYTKKYPPKFNKEAINLLANKPKKSLNSHIYLATQRPTINDFNTRQMSTIVDNINENEQLDKKIFKTNHNKLEEVKALKTVKPITLSEEQEKIQNLVLDGKNIFYTGSAGTGKSILLRSIIKELKKKHSKNEGAVAVTASTGLAACNIGGSTLHSFAGIGLGKEPYQDLLNKIKKNKRSREKWQACKVLVIDEISMISGDLFNKLDNIACSLRKSTKPFGGIQIVACGDFFQLPPVIKNDEENTSRFCFSSHSWKRTMDLSISLTKVFRQKGDLEFIDILNDMRLGKVSDKTVEKFKELERPLSDEDGIIPAELFSTRTEVERANYYRLKNINEPSEIFYASDGGILTNVEQRQRLLSNFMAPEKLELKKGAQVMMIKNIDDNLVNGSLGKVVDFMDSATHLAYKSITEDLNADDEMILAKALMRREKEAKKLGEEVPDFNEDFLPIPTSQLEDTIFDFMEEIQTDDEEVSNNIKEKKRLIKRLKQSSVGRKCPLVKFLTPDGNSRTILVAAETWTVDDEKSQPLVSRTQLPLILAWALSIHKSQGQTLPKVTVNLGRVFEKGQAYVAVSRAVSREGLQVLNFNRDKVFVHPDVLEFYEGLKNVDFYLNDDNLLKPEIIDLEDGEELQEESDPIIFQPRNNTKRIKLD